MELTSSYSSVLPERVRQRYRCYETRNACAMLQAASPAELVELVQVLDDFALTTEHLTTTGGNEGPVAKALNAGFRSRGWRESEVSASVTYELRVNPWGSTEQPTIRRFEAAAGELASSYLIDNFKGRVALDVEWNAKDGNLARDLAAYRAYYDAAIIDVAVLITREHAELRDFAWQVRRDAGMPEHEARSFLTTTTTTNITKLLPMLQRGDAGGCPVLAVAIAPQTYTDQPARRDVASYLPGTFDETVAAAD